MKPVEGVLVLEATHGQPAKEFEGILFGAPVSADSIRTAFKTQKSAPHAAANSNRDRGYGEVVFNTALTGYQETLTDPSYYGQIITMTCPHIGNTGVNEEDLESARIWAAAFVVHELPRLTSNWRSTGTLDHFLKQRGVPGIAGVDTRALTRTLRSQGVMRGILLPKSERSQAESLLAELPSFEGRDLIREVTAPQPYDWKSPVTPKAPRYQVVAVDFGLKWNLLRCLEEVGCQVKVVPATATAKEIMALKPDGVFLTNGPGDPSAAPYAVSAVKEILGKVPVFGVCMGHQILSLALGGRTYKLKFGHRGSNQPVQDLATGQVEISSHNHGYSVDGASLPSGVTVGHINLNDKTVEGLDYPSRFAFSVQYHPEASPGPHDSKNLFTRFTEMMSRFNVSKVS